MRYFAVVFVALIAVLAGMVAADAKGTVSIQESGGPNRTYEDVTLVVMNKALYLTTADKKGTLIISDAACTLVEKLLRCLPYAASLKQNGKTKPIKISSGSIYFNTTDEVQTLKYPSMELPAKGVRGVVRTNIGSYVSISGRLDDGTVK